MLDFLELERGLSDLEITKDLLRTAAAKAWLARNKDRSTAGTETGDDPYPTFQSQVTVTDQVPSFFQFGKKEGKNVTPCMVKWHLCFKLTIEVGLLNPIVILIG